MLKHQETHPGLNEPGCDVCRYSTVAIAPSATPTRKGGAEAADVKRREAALAKDMPAYKALRAQGLQPPHIAGSHRLQGATDKLEVEAGGLFPTPEARKKVRDEMRAAADFMAEAEAE